MPMQKVLNSLALGLALCGSAVVHADSARAAELKLVVPFPPGGSADVLARLLSQQVSQANNVTVLVETHPGAGTVIATEYVSRAPSDGNTALIVANAFIINPYIRKLHYDPPTSFRPVCEVVTSPQVIVVNATSPYRTLADLTAAAQARPGELTMASVGPATTQHIGVEQLKTVTKAPMTYVPFPGGAPAVNALLGGHVTAVYTNYSEVIEFINAGRLRAMATPSRVRIPSLPELPTVAELGYPEYEVEVWFGLVVPAATSSERVEQLGRWFTAAMQAPDVKARLAGLGLYPVVVCGDQFAAVIRKKHDEYDRIIREANIVGE